MTELVTGLDLVKLQIRVAAGEPLPIKQEDLVLRGHAIECRVYAEDPSNNFFPSPGKITARRVPSGPGIRLDDGVYAGWTVPNEYDPLLGKLVAWGSDRAEAAARMRRALGEYSVSGIETNLALFRRLLVEPSFLRGEIHTRWLDEWLAAQPAEATAAEAGANEVAAVIAAALWKISRNGARRPVPQAEESRWKREARQEQVDREPRK